MSSDIMTMILGRAALVATGSVAIAELWVVRAAPGTLLLHATIETILYYVFASGLLIATFVDIEWMEIPDEVSLPCAALGLVSAPFRVEPGLWSAAVGAGAANAEQRAGSVESTVMSFDALGRSFDFELEHNSRLMNAAR